jgi:hypothetical protein
MLGPPGSHPAASVLHRGAPPARTCWLWAGADRPTPPNRCVGPPHTSSSYPLCGHLPPPSSTPAALFKRALHIAAAPLPLPTPFSLGSTPRAPSLSPHPLIRASGRTVTAPRPISGRRSPSTVSSPPCASPLRLGGPPPCPSPPQAAGAPRGCHRSPPNVDNFSAPPSVAASPLLEHAGKPWSARSCPAPPRSPLVLTGKTSLWAVSPAGLGRQAKTMGHSAAQHCVPVFFNFHFHLLF